MNIITYLDQEFEVPEWAKFIAADSDGPVYVFSHEPKLDVSSEDKSDYVYVRAAGRNSNIQRVGKLDVSINSIHPIKKVVDETNPAIETLISQLHSGALKASSLFETSQTTKFFPGDVVRFKDSKSTAIISEAHLETNGSITYATTGSAWHKGEEFELVEASSEKTRITGANQLCENDEEDLEEV